MLGVRSSGTNDAKMDHLFSFGVVADVQHADRDSKMVGHGQKRMRYYRDTLDGLREAVNYWCDQSPHEVTFLLQLGDIIDGCNRHDQQTNLALERALEQLEKFPGEVHHCVGNHELYNFKRNSLNNTPLCNTSLMDASNRDGNYYAFSPHPRFRFVMLDTFERSLIGYESTDAVYIETEAYLRARNPAKCLMDPSLLEGTEKRFVNFNGAPSDTQLAWLDRTLHNACEAGQHVVVFGHGPMHPGSCESKYLCWRYDEVLALFHKYGCVRAYLAGHCHAGGYIQDDQGIHHLTAHAMVEATPGNPDFATVHVYQDKMEVRGQGRLPSFTIDLQDIASTSYIRPYGAQGTLNSQPTILSTSELPGRRDQADGGKATLP